MASEHFPRATVIINAATDGEPDDRHIAVGPLRSPLPKLAVLTIIDFEYSPEVTSPLVTMHLVDSQGRRVKRNGKSLFREWILSIPELREVAPGFFRMTKVDVIEAGLVLDPGTYFVSVDVNGKGLDFWPGYFEVIPEPSQDPA